MQTLFAFCDDNDNEKVTCSHRIPEIQQKYYWTRPNPIQPMDEPV